MHLQVPGLTQEFIEQLRESTENDGETALWKFAEGLLEMGDPDKAVAVYYNLLRSYIDQLNVLGFHVINETDFVQQDIINSRVEVCFQHNEVNVLGYCIHY